MHSDLGRLAADSYLVNVGEGIINSGRVYDMLCTNEPQVAAAAEQVAASLQGAAAAPGSVHASDLPSPNNLSNARAVLFGVAPGYRLGQATAHNLLRGLIQASLLSASQKGASSIAMPVMSADLQGFPFADAFDIIAEEALAFLQNNAQQTLRSVSIVSINPQKISIMKARLRMLSARMSLPALVDTQPAAFFATVRNATAAFGQGGLAAMRGDELAALLLNRGANVPLARFPSGAELAAATCGSLARSLGTSPSDSSYILLQAYLLEAMARLSAAELTRTNAARAGFSPTHLGVLGWVADDAEKWLTARRWASRSPALYNVVKGTRGSYLASVTAADLAAAGVDEATAAAFIGEVRAEVAATLRASGVSDTIEGIDGWSAAYAMNDERRAAVPAPAAAPAAAPVAATYPAVTPNFPSVPTHSPSVTPNFPSVPTHSPAAAAPKKKIPGAVATPFTAQPMPAQPSAAPTPVSAPAPAPAPTPAAAPESDDSASTVDYAKPERQTTEWLRLSNRLKCPMSRKYMTDPVTTSDGTTFERDVIMEWLAESLTSPVTGEPLASADLTPNVKMAGELELFYKANPTLRGT